MLGALGADWALRRVCLFLLRRALGRVLSSEVDVAQLDLQLSAGTVELRDLLLNCAYINSLLVRPQRPQPTAPPGGCRFSKGLSLADIPPSRRAAPPRCSW